MRNNFFSFALAFFQAIDIFLFIFNLFPPFTERGRRNLEESINNENHWPQILHVSGVECHIDRFVCFTAYLSPFPKENAFPTLEENLWTINRKTEFPDFSLTLTISKIFPDFSLTLKNFRFFPDFSLTAATLKACLPRISWLSPRCTRYLLVCTCMLVES